MSNKSVKDTIARPLRTGVQVTAGVIAADFVDAWFFDMTEAQYGSLAVVITVVFAFMQNVSETYFGFAFGRDAHNTDEPVVSNYQPQHRKGN